MKDKKVKLRSKNRKGEETSGRSYLLFIEGLLRQHNGVMAKAAVYAAVEAAFKGVWGPEDRRPKPVGKHGKTAKWKNMVAWAIVAGRSKERKDTDRFFLGKEKGVGEFLVLTDPRVTPASWLGWIAQHIKKNKRRFWKKCPQCRKRVPISSRLCVCRYKFPPTTRKVDRLMLA